MRKQRILVVEDDADLAAQLHDSLIGYGYEVLGPASSGEGALELASKHPPDLVLMDIHLGGALDGVDTANQLRHELGVAILYMTANAGRETVERAKATIPVGYLLKPFSDRELDVCVEMALLRQQFETSLRAERERLNVTLRSIGDGVIATDVDARVVLLNSVAEELTGWKQAGAEGRPLADVFHIINEKTREPCENPVARVLRTGRIVGLANHTSLISRDGTERTISDSGAPILSAAGELIGAVLVFRDVTKQLRIEQEMQRAQRLESVGALAGGIAHDFNNLLTVITANVSYAVGKVEPADAEVIGILEEVLTACDRATHLTQQLLTFAGGGGPIRKSTSLRELVQTTAEFALRGSKSRSVCALPDDLHPVHVDAGQISQVLTNLIINADEAMPGGGVIEVRGANRRLVLADGVACPAGEYVEIAITDHGGGVTPEIAGRLFEPYFSTKQRGSGLGLATAYSIVKKHDGLLTVDSRAGAGATFRVLLPVAKELPPSRSSAEVNSRRALAARRRARVLVMDDESALRAAMCVILTDLGYEVEDAADGAQALERFAAAKQRGRPFDLVLLDLTVRAGMGGLETLGKLQELDAAVCAIAASGYAPDPVLAQPQKYGFVASLPKPYRREDLGLLVQQTLDRKGVSTG